MSVFEFLQNNRVIPVLVVDDAKLAVPMARALVDGGITALEVTLRTDNALAVIESIAAQVPEAIVGAGTVLNAQQFNDVNNAGGKFVVSPGLTESLLQIARDTHIPWLPGAVTATEIMQAMEYELYDLKFFPAAISGGTAALSACSSVFQQVRFCPTGGVSPDNMEAYLKLPNVSAVGGSWLVTAQMLANQDWPEITATARQAVEKAATIKA